MNAKRIAIIAFCVWHMFAITIFALPRDAKGPVRTALYNTFNPLTRPYVLMTSQWQVWNLFAPNPLRRITTFALDGTSQGVHVIKLITPQTYPWWRHAIQYKLFSRTLDQDPDDKDILEHMTQQFCREFLFDSGTDIALSYHLHVIPWRDTPASIEWWQNWVPEVTAESAYQTTCDA